MKVIDLEGMQLDYWVARALGFKDVRIEDEYVCSPCPEERGAFDIHSYSTDWAQGGPIMEREGIEVTVSGIPDDDQKGGFCWEASTNHLTCGGDTPLEALCRVFVASKFGRAVDENNA